MNFLSSTKYRWVQHKNLHRKKSKLHLFSGVRTLCGKKLVGEISDCDAGEYCSKCLMTIKVMKNEMPKM